MPLCDLVCEALIWCRPPVSRSCPAPNSCTLLPSTLICSASGDTSFKDLFEALMLSHKKNTIMAIARRPSWIAMSLKSIAMVIVCQIVFLYQRALIPRKSDGHDYIDPNVALLPFLSKAHSFLRPSNVCLSELTHGRIYVLR